MREGAREIQAMQGWRWLVTADLQAEMRASDFQWPLQILHKKCGKDLKGGGSAKAPTKAQVQLLQWKELTLKPENLPKCISSTTMIVPQWKEEKHSQIISKFRCSHLKKYYITHTHTHT